MADVSDINSEIRNRGQKYPDPRMMENIIAPDNEINKAPANEMLNNKSRCNEDA